MRLVAKCETYTGPGYTVRTVYLLLGLPVWRRTWTDTVRRDAVLRYLNEREKKDGLLP